MRQQRKILVKYLPKSTSGTKKKIIGFAKKSYQR